MHVCGLVVEQAGVCMHACVYLCVSVQACPVEISLCTLQYFDLSFGCKHVEEGFRIKLMGLSCYLCYILPWDVTVVVMACWLQFGLASLITVWLV